MLRIFFFKFIILSVFIDAKYNWNPLPGTRAVVVNTVKQSSRNIYLDNDENNFLSNLISLGYLICHYFDIDKTAKVGLSR